MPILNRCRVALPGVVVRVVEGHSELIAESLTSGRVELALLYGDHPRRMIASDVLRRDEIVAVTAADAPWADFASISLQEFERIPLVLPRRPHATWAMLDATGVHPGRVIESDTLLEMLQHVHDGAGVTLLAAGAVEQECAAGTVRIIRPAPPGLSRALVLGRAANHPMPAAAEAVGELIRAEFTAITAG